MISFADETEHQFYDLIFAILSLLNPFILFYFFYFFFFFDPLNFHYSHISCCDTTQEPEFFDPHKSPQTPAWGLTHFICLACSEHCTKQFLLALIPRNHCLRKSNWIIPSSNNFLFSLLNYSFKYIFFSFPLSPYLHKVETYSKTSA